MSKEALALDITDIRTAVFRAALQRGAHEGSDLDLEPAEALALLLQLGEK